MSDAEHLPDDVGDDPIAGARTVDLWLFEVKGVMLHEIPERPLAALMRKKEIEDTAPVLTNEEAELNDDLRFYLENKIKVSLQTRSFPVEFDAGSESIVPPLVSDMLSRTGPDGEAPPTFVDSSQAIAHALHASQKHGNPTGLLAVVRGVWRKQPMIAVLKLEREEGLRIQRVEDDKGNVSLTVTVERELVMTQNTKVFKTGVFRLMDDAVIPEEAEEGTAPVLVDVDGWVSDVQTGYGGRGKVAADFYVGRFLGCRLVDLPEILTKKFFEETERWINKSVPDAVQQTKYTRALLAEMTNNEAVVNPTNFASTNLQGDDRQAFVAALGDRSAPTNTFPKDTTLIANRLADVDIRFKSGMAASVKRAHFDEGIATLEADEDDPTLTVLTIRDRIEWIRGG